MHLPYHSEMLFFLLFIVNAKHSLIAGGGEHEVTIVPLHIIQPEYVLHLLLQALFGHSHGKVRARESNRILEEIVI